MSDDNEIPTLETILEAPPAQEASTGGLSAALFTDDSIAVTGAKLAVLEALLGLIPRNCSFHDFMRDLLIAVMKAVKSEAGSLLELDQQSKVLFFRSVVGQSSDRVARYIIPLGQGVVGHVAESRQPLVVNNIEENRVYLKSIEEAVGFAARNLVAVPIIVRGRVFGVLELLNRVGEENYTPGDVELLTYFTGIAAKAIEIRLMIGWAMQRKPGGSQDAA